jgi:hypothetical protein
VDRLDTPLGVVTVTSTVPEVCGGDTAVIDVLEFTVNDVARNPPKNTVWAPVKFVPVMATMVPPLTGPDVGAMLVTVGRVEAVNVKRSVLPRAEVPLAVVTVISTVPACSAGDIAVIKLSE